MRVWLVVVTLALSLSAVGCNQPATPAATAPTTAGIAPTTAAPAASVAAAEAPPRAATIAPPAASAAPAIAPAATVPGPTAAPAAATAASAAAPRGVQPTIAPAPGTAPRILVYVRDNALWVAGFDGTPPRQISPDGLYPLPANDTTVQPAAVAPDTRWVIGTTPDARQGTWLFATDGSSRRQLDAARLITTWAPNSQGYAWADETGVYVKTLAEDARPLTAARMEGAARVLPNLVSWAPQGDQIVFQVKDGDTLSLRSVSAAGGPVKMLAQVKMEAPTDYGPDALVWSPDGARALWVLPSPNRLVALDGSPAVELPTDIARVYGFTPDSKRLLAVWRAGNNYRLGTTDLTGKDRREVAAAKGDFGYGSVSPDGRQIAYVRFPDDGPGPPETNELWLVGVDGQGPRRIGQGSDLAPFSADWLGPGALLVANGETPPDISLRRVDTGSGAAQKLVDQVSWFFAIAPR